MKTFKKLITFFVAVVVVCTVGIFLYSNAKASTPSFTAMNIATFPPSSYFYTDISSDETLRVFDYTNNEYDIPVSISAGTPIIFNHECFNPNYSDNQISYWIYLDADTSPTLLYDYNQGKALNLTFENDVKLAQISYDSQPGPEKIIISLYFVTSDDGNSNDEPTQTPQPKKPYTDALENNIKSLAALIKAGEVTDNNITWSEGQALPASVMNILKDNPNVTLTFNFDYLGNSYSITVKGSDVIDLGDDVDWYGPECLIRYYGSLLDKVNLAISKAN